MSIPTDNPEPRETDYSQLPQSPTDFDREPEDPSSIPREKAGERLLLMPLVGGGIGMALGGATDLIGAGQVLTDGGLLVGGLVGGVIGLIFALAVFFRTRSKERAQQLDGGNPRDGDRDWDAVRALARKRIDSDESR